MRLYSTRIKQSPKIEQIVTGTIKINKKFILKIYDEFAKKITQSEMLDELDNLHDDLVEFTKPHLMKVNDNDFDPLYRAQYYIDLGMDIEEVYRNSMLSFIDKIKNRFNSMLDFQIEIVDDDTVDMKIPTKTSSQTTIASVGTYVAGDSISITNITNILQNLKEEIENETNLTPQEREELKKEVSVASGKLEKIGNIIVKYGGRLTGYTARTFLGLD